MIEKKRSVSPPLPRKLLSQQSRIPQTQQELWKPYESIWISTKEQFEFPKSNKVLAFMKLLAHFNLHSRSLNIGNGNTFPEAGLLLLTRQSLSDASLHVYTSFQHITFTWVIWCCGFWAQNSNSKSRGSIGTPDLEVSGILLQITWGDCRRMCKGAASWCSAFMSAVVLFWISYEHHLKRCNPV